MVNEQTNWIPVTRAFISVESTPCAYAWMTCHVIMEEGLRSGLLVQDHNDDGIVTQTGRSAR